MATRKRGPAQVAAADTGPDTAVRAIRHPARRRNIPPAGLEAQGRVEEAPKLRHEYNPHLPPVLRFADNDAAAADRLPALLATARERALSEDEARVLADALRRHEPWLEWSGKRERPWFEVEPPALHIHERVSTQAMLRVLAREDVNRDLFADPQQSYAEAVQFYKHDVDWANRMILGDSLAVMASLARREDLAGKVQMIYIDPPYGISFKSNFQPQLGQRDVKDREQDLTREPEMVKAYRDTWTLGIHSYLAYLRDRLAMARELLSESGSVFVQISDENLHRVRAVMDEVFGAENFCTLVAVQKTGAFSPTMLSSVADYLIWYARNKANAKFLRLYLSRERGGEGTQLYNFAESPTGAVRRVGEAEVLAPRDQLFQTVSIQSPGASATDTAPFEFQAKLLRVNANRHWATNAEGRGRLANAERLVESGEESVRFKMLLTDYPAVPISNIWTDTQQGGFNDAKVYVVQTATKVIERCLLMTTDPGDLVLDPTCGSGTTAFVAEKWGRRWITIDSSRVALALAKHRLMTASFEHFKLRALAPEDLQRNPRGSWLRNGDATAKTFDCRTVPHITLKSIARNTSLDPIFAKHEPLLAEKLAALNAALGKVGAELKDRLAARLVRKHREEGASAVTDADIRRWLLPGTQPGLIREAKAAKPLKALSARQAAAYRAAIPAAQWQPWQVPFDTDSDWPAPLAAALQAYRAAWRAKMDEVNACIAANAEVEELVDQPLTEPGIVRVAGPFTMEGVIAHEQGLDDDSPIAGAPDEMESFGDDGGVASAGALGAVNAEAHLDKILRLLKASGVDFERNVNKRFGRLEPMASSALLHAEGAWLDDAADRRVAVSIGPEVGNVTAFQVEDAVRSANRMGYDEVVFAGFGFDAAAQAAIDEATHPKLRLHMALIRPDVAMGELLKTQPGSQLFMVFSAPRVKPPERVKGGPADGQFTIEVEGMDVYDPVANAIHPTSRDRIAAWFVDTDYDGRTFCICQAFFPDRSKWDKLARALGARGVVDEGRFDALAGWQSLPFARPTRLPAGAPWRVAVKVIDPRGNEGLRVVTMASA
ncbi:MAG TPA: site-specific DNA-methyltransferase [Burkholderiaceae bacterium]|nr:site-specific DNA-methyltransferase [Burkholderiaceae bacterium]